MTLVGLTGGLASGKTTVLGMFRRLGAEVLSSDNIIHDLLKNDKKVQARLRGMFGSGVFRRGCTVDRGRLARRVFLSPRDLKKLEALLHPRVKKEILFFAKRVRLEKKDAVVVVEVPLLFEAGWQDVFDRIVTVIVRPSVQRRRMRKGPHGRQTALKERLARQMPLEKKARGSDYVIDNNLTKRKTWLQVKTLWGILEQQKRRLSGGKA